MRQTFNKEFKKCTLIWFFVHMYCKPVLSTPVLQTGFVYTYTANWFCVHMYCKHTDIISERFCCQAPTQLPVELEPCPVGACYQCRRPSTQFCLFKEDLPRLYLAGVSHMEGVHRGVMPKKRNRHTGKLTASSLSR